MNRLLDAVEVIDVIGAPDQVNIADVRHDSRDVAPGDLFCCLVGALSDGHLHAPAAVRAGAVGIVGEHFIEGLPDSVPQALVRPGTGRAALAHLAAANYGQPASALTMAAVTGTNGKTTVTHVLAAILEAAGLGTRVIGTLTSERTTPEADDLQRELAMWRDGSTSKRAVAMEVSSHALMQSRVDDICFDVAGFTNLTHDHLDYHGTMEAYFAAKASLFTPERARRAVINVDDPYGRRLAGSTMLDAVAVTRSDLEAIETTIGASRFRWRGQMVQLSMPGVVAIDNAHLGAEMALALGLDIDLIVTGLESARGVTGRFEVVLGRPNGPLVVVDYAHSPDALAATLAGARPLVAGPSQLVVVFGCGGDRDRTKRPQMGHVAAELADRVIVTTDNPRSEDPGEIIDDIVAGMGDALERGRALVVADRRQAIELALQTAAGGDLIIIAGKGHERYQEIAGKRVDFDDRVVVHEWMESAAATGGR